MSPTEILALVFLSSVHEEPRSATEWLLQLNVLQVVGMISLLAMIVGGIWKVYPHLKRIGNLLDDWSGEPARPGVPRRPGVMERLEQHDQAVSSLGNHVEVVARLQEISVAVHAGNTKTEDVEALLQRHIRESSAWVAELDRRASERGFEVPPWPHFEKNPTEGK